MEENKEITRLHTFIRQLCIMRYPPAFILDKAFTYALKLQAEMYSMQCTLRGLSSEGVDEMNTEWMEHAAIWMEQAIKMDHRIYEQLCGNAGTVV